MWHLLYATGSSGILFWLKQKWIGPGVINKLQNFSFKLRLLSKTENCNMTNFIDFHQKFKLLISRKASKQIKIGSNFFFNIKLFLCKFTPHHIYLGMYKNRVNNERKLLKFQLANKEIQNSKILNNMGTWYKYFEYPHSNFYLREFQNLSVIPYPIFTRKPSIYLFSIIFIQECWIMTDSRILFKFDNFFATNKN